MESIFRSKNKDGLKILIFLVLNVLLIISVEGFTETTFNNSLGTEIFLMNSTENITRFLQVPDNVLITNAFLSLNGFSFNMSDPVTYYKLDNSSGVVFDMTGNNDGGITGGMTRGVPGKLNTAFNFSITALITPTVQVRGWPNGTFNVWFNTTTISGTQDIYSTHSGGSDSGIGIRDDKLFFNSQTQWFFESTSLVTINTWIMATFVWNTTGEFIYFNGVEENSASDGGGWLSTGSTAQFGARSIFMDNVYKGILDEIGVWNRSLSSEEIFNLYNSNEVLPFENLFSKLENVTIILNGTSVFNHTGEFNQTFSPNRTNNFAPTINSFLSICNFVGGFCQIPFIFHTDIEGRLQYFNMTFNNSGFIENNISFNATSSIGKIETFSLNMTFDLNVFTPSVFLIYNGTSQTATTTDPGSTRVYSATRVIPTSSTDENYTFHFMVENVNGSFNSSFNNQSVTTFNISICGGAFTNPIYNFTLFDEELQTQLSSTTSEFALNLFSEDRSVSLVNLSGTTLLNPWSICLNAPIPEDVIYSVDLIIQYEADDYAQEFYNIINRLITNTTGTEEIGLYDLHLNESVEFQLTFTGNDFIPVENALVHVDRQYISEDLFRTVEIPKTDSNGQTVLHLVRNNVLYNIRIIKDGVLIGNFRNIIAFCDDVSIGDCKIALPGTEGVSPISDYDSTLGIIFDGPPTYDISTNRISFTFTSSDGSVKTVLLVVEQRDIFGNRSICSNELISSSGSISCNIGSANETNTELVSSIFIDGVLLTSSTTNIDSFSYGDIGFIAWFVFTLIIVIISRDSKDLLIGSVLLSYLGAVGLGITKGGAIGLGSTGAWILVVTLAAWWNLNKGRSE